MYKNKSISIIKEDNNYQRIDVVKRNRNKRHKYNEFFVEGVRSINEAIKNNWKFKKLIYCEDVELSSWAEKILTETPVETVYEVSTDIMSKISEKEDTSEIVAIVEMKDDNFKRVKINKNPLIVISDRPSNKGNLGTLIRSCDALGVDGLIITGHCVDLYDSGTIVATMGSFFKLPTLRVPSYREILELIKELTNKFPDLQIIGTSAKCEKMIYEQDFIKPTILLIGNETDGLSKNYKDISNSLVKIPIGGSASSLNVSCAASIVLYEINRQRNT